MIYKKNFKQAFFNIGMGFSISAIFLILFRTFITYRLFQTGQEMDVLSVTVFPLAMSAFVPFAAIFPILPYAFSFLEEKNSGYCKYILLRCSHTKYIFNKIFFTGLSGGISMVIPFSILFIISILISQEVSPDFFPYMYEGKIWEPFLMIWGGKFVLLQRLVLIFLFGILWAEIALLVSAIITNRYVVFVVPFVIYQLGWMLFPPLINPVGLLRADYDQSAFINIWTPYMIQCFFIVFVITFTAILIKKKVKDE